MLWKDFHHPSTPSATHSNSTISGYSLQRTSPGVLLSPGEGSVEQLACEICRMIYYQFSSHPGITGTFQVVSPLQVGYRNVEDTSSSARWLAAVIAYVSNFHAFEAVRYARNFTDASIVVWIICTKNHFKDISRKHKVGMCIGCINFTPYRYLPDRKSWPSVLHRRKYQYVPAACP
jgi:hypothetical protein